VDTLAQSVPPNMPSPTKVTALGLQQPRAGNQQRQQSLPGTKAPQLILQAAGAGTVEGLLG